MKLIINQNKEIPETEIIINCPQIDQRMRNLIDHIRQYSSTLRGSVDDSSMDIPLDTVMYIESVDRKTFLYDRHQVFHCRESLSELEQKIDNVLFVRISKNCIVNLTYIAATGRSDNHKLTIQLRNGERLTAGRAYVKELLARLNGFKEIEYYCDKRDDPTEKKVFSIRNIDRILRFSCVPQRIIAVTYASAELLCTLGLEERIVGIVSRPEEAAHLLPDNRIRLKNVPAIQGTGTQLPLIQELKSLQPDFIFSTYYYWNYLNRSGCNIEGVPLYISEASVPGKTVINFLYRDIWNLGKVFCVEDMAVKLTNKIQENLTKLPVKPFRYHTPSVFVYDSGTDQPITSLAETFESHLISLAGGKNIFSDRQGAYQPISWHDVAEENPEFVLIHDYHDFPSPEEKKEMLKSGPEIKDCIAVKNNAFLTVTLPEVFPGIQNVAAVERMFKTFNKGHI